MRSTGVLSAVLVLMVCVAGAGAQDAPRLAFLADAPAAGALVAPVSVNLTRPPEEDGELRGTADLLLRNTSDYAGPIRLRFVPSASGVDIGLATPGSAGRAGASPTVTVTLERPDPLVVAASSVTAVTIAFTVTGAPGDGISGVVIAEVASTTAGTVRPATRTVTLVPPTDPPDLTKLTAAHEESAGQATIYWSAGRHWVRGGEVEVWVGGVDVEEVAAAIAVSRCAPCVVDLSGYLSSDRGDTVRMRTTQNVVDGNGVRVTLRPAEDGDVESGTYTGNVTRNLGPDGGPSFNVTLKSQHMIAWPILFTLAGGGVAWATTWLAKVRRPKKALQAKLSEAQATYVDTKKKLGAEADLAPFDLDNTFQSLDGRHAAAAAWSAVEHAETEEALDAAAAEVGRITDVVTLWPDVVHAAKTLRTARDRLLTPMGDDLLLIPVPEEMPILRATNALLDTGQEAPRTAATTAERIQALRDQSTAVGLWIDLYKLATHTDVMYESLLDAIPPDDPQRATLVDKDPLAIRSALLETSGALDDIRQREIDERLLEASRVVLALARATRQTPAVSYVDATEAGRVFYVQTSDAGAVDRLATAVGTHARRLFQPPPAAVIRAEMRRLDWLEFATSVAIAATVYVLTVYDDGDFGTWRQYATAFLTGATVTFVTQLGLLPWFRSYRAGDKAEAAAPGPATA